MKKLLTGLVVMLGFAISGVAQASGAFTGRIGLTGGTFDYDSTETDSGVVTTDAYDDTTYGLGAGTTLAIGRFFTDVGFEYSTYADEDDFYRTDGLLSLGVYIGDRWVIFGGYRSATFGDGFFSDTGTATRFGNTEKGPFLGGGVSFRPGSRVSLGASLAYNLLTFEIEGTPIDDLDLTGISAKLQLNLLETPHSFFLRYQRFDGDFDQPQFSYQFEYTENYVNLGYQLTVDFTSW